MRQTPNGYELVMRRTWLERNGNSSKSVVKAEDYRPKGIVMRTAETTIMRQPHMSQTHKRALLVKAS